MMNEPTVLLKERENNREDEVKHERFKAGKKLLTP